MQTAATVQSIMANVLDILGLAIPIVIGLALVYFLWGLVGFIGNPSSEQAQTEGRSRMIWGVVAFFVIVSVWALVRVIANSIGVSPGGSIIPPKF